MMSKKKIGLALSGGGYRAAAFHIGTLKKLNELGVLREVNILSAISGGAITGAAYCLHNSDFKSFETSMINILSTKNVIKFVLTSWRFLKIAIPALFLLTAAFVLPFTRYGSYSILPLLLLIFAIIKYQFRLLPVSKIIESAYDNFFFKGATLNQLCDTPEIAIGSTNLQTQRHFTFSKRKMEDSTYAYYKPPIYFKGDNFPVARAVMASSCVPFAFTPVDIDKCYFGDQSMTQKVNPKLVDGGVYDNQGLHKLTYDGSSYSCEIVIVSDAGNNLPFDKLYNNTFTLLLRTVDTFMARIKNFQMMQNIYQKPNKREIAYLSLGWGVEGCLSGFVSNLQSGTISTEIIAFHKLSDQWVNSPLAHQNEIIQHLIKSQNLQVILDQKLSDDRVEKIRKVGTNLTCLKRTTIDD
ncbi:MAG TPA: patatin-like phospholipase family protein, partial [Candidatus Babeliaceae bacterium]|nr:patatin-like phospholipase family protein [Candidatus Babeliaceae bacterium]